MLNLRGTAPDLDPTDREGDGNGGIIRSPIRAIALPDNPHPKLGRSEAREASDAS
jgi:hypothetical protein